jgi:hydroxyacylglutathione hydrolase
MLHVRAFILGYYPIRGFLAWAEGDRAALLVDPGGWDDAITDTLTAEGLSVAAIALTHGHGDHTGGLKEAVAHLHSPVYICADEPGAFASSPETALRDGDVIHVGCLNWRALHVPGHTPGCMAYAAGDVVFTGDALFAGSVGGTSSHETYEQQRTAIRARLFPLGDSVRVYPAHGPASTIGIERRYNPFLMY